MQKTTMIIIATILLSCCKNVKTTKSDEKSDSSDKIFYQESILSEKNVKIDLINNDFNFSVILTIDHNKQVIDLNKEGIPTKEPELMWKNADYACILTWWSQSLSRHIFVPVKKENKFIYLDKNIEEMDSINNNIVYVDTVMDNDNKVLYVVENLLTHKKTEPISLAISEQNGVFPFFDSIKYDKKICCYYDTDRKARYQY